MNDSLMNNEDWFWSADLSVGVTQIDDDHKELFRLFHEAYQLSQQGEDNSLLYCLASDLVLYTESHFRREEAIMSASSYAFCEEHFLVHQQLVQQVKNQFLLVENNNHSALEFVVFLRDWFIEHIKHSDKQIAEYIVGYEDDIELALEKAGPLTIKETNHIYIVDDDEAYVNLMQAMIEMAGYSCTIYSSGSVFLESSVSDWDLVVLDLNMPEKDGIEVMRELTERQLTPSFVLISGFDERVLHSAKQFAESKQLNVVDTLTKPIEVDDFVDVVTRAYAACRLAFLQKEGRDSVSLNDAIDSNVIDKRNADISVEELRLGIKQQELIIYIQPQVHFSDDSLAGGEVLVRWQHPSRGLVFPDQFIPLAEEHQLMAELTEAVILQSIMAYRFLRQNSINTTLSINISAQNIDDLTLPEKLGGLLQTYDIKPEAFTLELTESAMLTDTSAALDIFNRLRMKGFSLSIDDFGTGDSSLKKLFQTPFSELKIDQHFVSRIEGDPDAISIVKVCTLLAKEFKMHTVAEGIETQQVWDKLKGLGCDIAQGYFIAKPMPVNDFVSWVLGRKN